MIVHSDPLLITQFLKNSHQKQNGRHHHWPPVIITKMKKEQKLQQEQKTQNDQKNEYIVLVIDLRFNF